MFLLLYLHYGKCILHKKDIKISYTPYSILFSSLILSSLSNSTSSPFLHCILLLPCLVLFISFLPISFGLVSSSLHSLLNSLQWLYWVSIWMREMQQLFNSTVCKFLILSSFLFRLCTKRFFTSEEFHAELNVLWWPYWLGTEVCSPLITIIARNKHPGIIKNTWRWDLTRFSFKIYFYCNVLILHTATFALLRVQFYALWNMHEVV